LSLRAGWFLLFYSTTSAALLLARVSWLLHASCLFHPVERAYYFIRDTRLYLTWVPGWCSTSWAIRKRREMLLIPFLNHMKPVLPRPPSKEPHETRHTDLQSKGAFPALNRRPFSEKFFFQACLLQSKASISRAEGRRMTCRLLNPESCDRDIRFQPGADLSSPLYRCVLTEG
jgi:hypothetical protein